jgi:hypothetical protein
VAEGFQQWSCIWEIYDVESLLTEDSKALVTGIEELLNAILVNAVLIFIQLNT